MTRAELLSFLRHHRIAVEATVGADGAPQAAVVAIAVTDGLELIFDTLEGTQKYANLRAAAQRARRRLGARGDRAG
jgi:hypothetical protein